MSKLIEHHTKYKEIHGVDETVWITRSEHSKLHIRLRKEGKCNISTDELRCIARAAQLRTEKYISRRKIRDKEYNISKKGKYIRNKYNTNVLSKIEFTETPGMFTSFHETIIYNTATGTVTYSHRFYGTNGYKLPMINI